MQLLLTSIAIAFTCLAFFPYIHSILKGKTKPHIFSWIIWGFSTFTVCFAQLAGGGGIGAWPIGFSGVVTFFIAFLAYQRKADITITTADWVFFILALSSLPLWYITADPLWAVVILTTTDSIGFLPTLRKGFHSPHQESLWLYYIMTIRNGVVIVSLDEHSLTTVLFPAAISFWCIVFIGITHVRRHITAA